LEETAGSIFRVEHAAFVAQSPSYSLKDEPPAVTKYTALKRPEMLIVVLMKIVVF
jgi:hypothetical protein